MSFGKNDMKCLKDALNHEDPNVRLMVQFVQEAVRHLKKNDIQKASTCVRCAARFEDDIPIQFVL